MSRSQLDLHTAINRALDDVAAASEVRQDKYAALDKNVPALVCAYVGHEGQPWFFLRRFLARPWRCPRCSRWMVTRYVSTYMNDGSWQWLDVQDEAELL